MSSVDFNVYLEESRIDINLETILTEFIQLADTPNTFVGEAKKLVRVKETEDGLEFFNQVEEIVFIKQMTEAEIVAEMTPGKRFLVDNSDTGQLEYIRGMDRRVIV